MFSPNDYKKSNKVIHSNLQIWQNKTLAFNSDKIKIDETRKYLIEEIKHNVFICGKHNKTLKTLNYPEHFLLCISTTNECVSISAFASLFGVPVGITSSAEGLKICAVTAEIKKYNTFIKKKSIMK